jgi:hypothetical protein
VAHASYLPALVGGKQLVEGNSTLAVGLRWTAVAAGLGVLLAFTWLALSPVRSLRALPEESDPGWGAPQGAPAQ